MSRGSCAFLCLHVEVDLPPMTKRDAVTSLLLRMKLQWQLLAFIFTLSTTHCLKLSFPESILLKSRLKSIQESIIASSPALPPSDAENAAFVFPGAGGKDDLTEELTLRLEQEMWATTIDWKEYRGSIATAAFDGEAVGEAIASLLFKQQRLKYVHVIGISVGGFAANQMAKCLFESSSHKPEHVRLTLLDPFCSRGILGVGYGKRNFGVSADYAEHFLNTDDPVPTTNDPLPNCYCVDVTSAPERDSFELPQDETYHCWPVAHYARHGYRLERTKNGNIVYPRHDDRHARGMVTKLQ